ncbi:MAG TPA: hypothetical protein VKF83_00745 [Stellaceae bacterium]|nr:hypothetical protein [Stellaceae bacterium]
MSNTISLREANQRFARCIREVELVRSTSLPAMAGRLRGSCPLAVDAT